VRFRLVGASVERFGAALVEAMMMMCTGNNKF
jgi:hypothetical protein